MMYDIGGRKVRIDDKIIEKLKSTFELTQEEAIQMYLEDEGIEINEEQEALHEAAKDVKIDHGAKSQAEIDKKAAGGKRGPRKDEDKEQIIALLAETLGEGTFEAVEVINKGKTIHFDFNGKPYKIDLVFRRNDAKARG